MFLCLCMRSPPGTAVAKLQDSHGGLAISRSNGSFLCISTSFLIFFKSDKSITISAFPIPTDTTSWSGSAFFTLPLPSSNKAKILISSFPFVAPFFKFFAPFLNHDFIGRLKPTSTSQIALVALIASEVEARPLLWRLRFLAFCKPSHRRISLCLEVCVFAVKAGFTHGNYPSQTVSTCRRHHAAGL